MSFKAGFVGLVGNPNAGKSTLMNFLIDQKVSIVTAKPQTTRRRILGIHSSKDSQVIFIDAPGIIKAEKGLNAFLEKEIQEVISESDVLVAVLSLDEQNAEAIQNVVDKVKKSKKPWIAIITKTDLKDVAHRILIIKNAVEADGGKCFQLSSLRKDKESRNEILEAVTALLPESAAPLYDAEMFTTENVKDLAAEIIREKCFTHLSQELPYQMAVQIRKFDESSKKIPHIYADVMVAKESHKPIVVGKGAEIIKKISQESRLEIEKMMDQKVFLELNVVVKENWFDHQQTMKELGYVIERK